MSTLRRERVRDLLTATNLDRPVRLQGWVRTQRTGKAVSFLALNDGSTVHHIQCVMPNDALDEDLRKRATTGACVAVEGTLVASKGKGQSVEVQVSHLHVYGEADPETYPLQKKGHSLEFLRENAHLRPRTNTFGCIFRLRHGLAYAIHQFFHHRGFVYLHTPIITASDTEGAGEQFTVTTLPLHQVPRTPEGAVDYGQDFFGAHAHLTVSGQLNGELGALALGEVYTFGPTFRAENSNTTRHLAEFWMVEPEMAFYDLADNQDLAEDFLKHLFQFALANHADDLAFLQSREDAQPLIPMLEQLVNQPFERMPYTEAVRLLEASGEAFTYTVSWGSDLQAEHERWLVERHVGRPVILTDYPKEIKAFYMRQNEDGRTVAAMDVLCPRIGEVIGGSQREERLDRLTARLAELNLPEADYGWYLDTRRYGSAPHSGFGMGFERLVQFVSGMGNIRDVIPFPRTPGNVAF